MKKFIGLSAALLVAGAVLFSCSNGSSSNTSVYTVEHYQENADDDDYTLVDAESLEGCSGEWTSARVNAYDHFISPVVNQDIIAADGSTVIRLYYDREMVTVTLDLSEGVLDGDSGIITKTGKYGSIFFVNEPVRSGYVFERWSSNLPDRYYEDATYTALWTRTIPVGIEITVDISDIIVTKTENGNYITFEAEVCDSYHWLLGETEISGGQSCMLDISLLENGTYSLSLEAQKGGKWYSYFAQITVNK